MKRIEFHQTIEDEFKQRYEVIGQEIYQIRDSQEIDDISQEQNIPVWLLKRFNPKKATAKLKTGDHIILPFIQPISDQEP